MRFKLPAPVIIKLSDTTTVEYSLTDMVTHFVRRGREFSRDEESARAGKRILDAFAATKSGEVDLSDDDAKLLRAVARKPSCGWARHEVVIEIPTRSAEGVLLRKIKRHGQGAAVDYLPLIDALPNG